MLYTISLRAANGQFVCAEDGGGREVVANRNTVGDWEKFSLITIDRTRVALQTCNGKYLCAEDGGGREVVANRNVIAGWETFVIEQLGGDQVALKAANGQYLCAEDGGGREIVANRDTIGGWEVFQIFRHRRERVGLQAFNGQYVCAEGGGGREVVVNRNVPATWETFTIEDLGDGSAAFRAHNGQFLCAEKGGGREVVANRNAVGPWETFVIEELGWGRIALRASNGQYVCAERGGGQELVANRVSASVWETFRIVGQSAKHIVGGRVLYSVRNESDHVVCVKPENAPTVLRVLPQTTCEGPIDGLKIPGVGERMLKIVDNCDATVYNDRIEVQCDKLSIDSIGKKFGIELPSYEVPDSSGVNAQVIQRIFGGWTDVPPDSGWYALRDCSVAPPPDVEGSNRRISCEPNEIDRERFEHIDRNQYEIWEKEDREWVDRTA